MTILSNKGSCHAGGRSSVLEFVNPVVDGDIFEPEKCFSGVFNTFVSESVVCKIQ